MNSVPVGVRTPLPAPGRRSVEHMFDGVDDCPPAKKLCTGWVKKYDLTQDRQNYRSIDSDGPFSTIPVGPVEMTLHVLLTSGIDSETAEMMRSGTCDIIIRRQYP